MTIYSRFVLRVHWMWLEVGETEDCMMDAMYQEPGCGWR